MQSLTNSGVFTSNMENHNERHDNGNYMNEARRYGVSVLKRQVHPSLTKGSDEIVPGWKIRVRPICTFRL